MFYFGAAVLKIRMIESDELWTHLVESSDLENRMIEFAFPMRHCHLYSVAFQMHTDEKCGHYENLDSQWSYSDRDLLAWTCTDLTHCQSYFYR